MRNRPRRKGSTFAALLFCTSAAALALVLTLVIATSGTSERNQFYNNGFSYANNSKGNHK